MANEEKPVVNVRQGALQGLREKGAREVEFVAFRGIPYAKPPVGELRFKDPQPAEQWTGLRDASENGGMCAQLEFLTHEFQGSDDCLYLNVFVPELKPGAKKPVMFWIHGGAFQLGSGGEELYGPDYFMRKDVVLVTINYRVGVLGFLNLEDEVAPGNYGLKDQLMALKWVQENIAQFGGDPGNVTIFGESAGGASVHYLLLSPLAEGLYHKAIAQSGVATCTWAIPHPEPRRTAFQLAALLGKKSFDPKTIVEFLRTVDAKDLIMAQDTFSGRDDLIGIRMAFGPSIDIKSREPFMPQSPAQLMRTGVKVPLIIGSTDNEGGFYIGKTTEKFLEKLNNNFSQILPDDAVENLRAEGITMETVKKAYFGDDPISMKKIHNYADLLSDLMFLKNLYEVVGIQMDVGRQNTFLYRYSYSAEHSAVKYLLNVQMKGAIHSEELSYLFYPRFAKTKGIEFPEQTPAQARVSDMLVQMWTDFARTGNPTPAKTELIPVTWNPLRKGNTYDYLNIGEQLRMESEERGVQRYDWKRLTSKL